MNDVRWTRRLMMVSDDNRGTVVTNNKYLPLKSIYLIESQK